MLEDNRPTISKKLNANAWFADTVAVAILGEWLAPTDTSIITIFPHYDQIAGLWRCQFDEQLLSGYMSTKEWRLSAIIGCLLLEGLDFGGSNLTYCGEELSVFFSSKRRVFRRNMLEAEAWKSDLWWISPIQNWKKWSCESRFWKPQRPDNSWYFYCIRVSAHKHHWFRKCACETPFPIKGRDDVWRREMVQERFRWTMSINVCKAV